MNLFHQPDKSYTRQLLHSNHSIDAPFRRAQHLHAPVAMSPGPGQASTSPSAGAGTLSLVVHAAGLVVVYSLYSVLQEKIMKTGYGACSSFDWKAMSRNARAILASCYSWVLTRAILCYIEVDHAS